MTSTVTGLAAIVIFLLLAGGYVIKAYLFRKKTSEEFHHPDVGNFFGTIPISVLLLSAVIRPWHTGVSRLAITHYTPQTGEYQKAVRPAKPEGAY